DRLFPHSGGDRACQLRVVVDPGGHAGREHVSDDARTVERPSAADREAAEAPGCHHGGGVIRLVAVDGDPRDAENLGDLPPARGGARPTGGAAPPPAARRAPPRRKADCSSASSRARASEAATSPRLSAFAIAVATSSVNSASRSSVPEGHACASVEVTVMTP